MKRRSFIAQGAAGVAGMGLTGCSSVMNRKTKLWKEIAPYTYRPAGTMPMGEIGNTGIKVSKFGFGSHIPYERGDTWSYDKVREHMIHEAYDLGVRVFDVYDIEQEFQQYEPFGKQIAPFKNDVVISISFKNYDGRTPEQELQRDLKLFGRDYIDLARVQRPADDPIWEKLFRWKEKGYIRAVGAHMHNWQHFENVYDKLPVDYMLFPYNFYHNKVWLESPKMDFTNLQEMLREKGIGVLTMKAFAGDYLVKPLIDVSRTLNYEPEINFNRAALRYVINSEVKPDVTLTGMYNLYHVYENIGAYYEPAMSDEERNLLNDIKKSAHYIAGAHLPDHYKWMEDWAESPASNHTFG
jgi:aryl-alcohol dehydrogenase-like predicted oxidoreductase